MFQLASNLSDKIMKNHAYQDGNKRTAPLAAAMFLKINGHVLRNIPFQEDSVNRGQGISLAAAIVGCIMA